MGLHQKLGTFGDVAAEQDAVLSYFLKTSAVGEIEIGKATIVLGRKGSGKTALSRYFSTSREGYLSKSLSLRDYPWSLHQQRVNLGASEIESYVTSWRYLIAVQSIVLLLQECGVSQQTDSQRNAREFLERNYGGISPSLQDILRPKRLFLSKASFLPSIMGNSIGGIDLETDKGGLAHETEALTDMIAECAATIASQVGKKKILLHFDELDQGLSLITNEYKRMIVGLILACRSFREYKLFDVDIRPICYLRTDIWDELRFSDKNKITQSQAVVLEWDSDSLLALVNERIKAKLGTPYNWNDIEDGSVMRGSQPKWNHIIARTFLRPRDVIQFLNCALQISLERQPDANIFDNDDIQLAREPYSKYLKQEIDDELVPHWEKWSEALQAFSELVTITFSRDGFVQAYEKRKSRKNDVPADEALEILYQFSVIGYRRGYGSGGSGWVFQYTDPQAGWDNGASRLKVHLGLKEFAKLREERSS